MFFPLLNNNNKKKKETEIWKNIPKQPGKPEAVMRKIKFTENMAKWSPQGTFLASLHRQGIMLWAGQVIDKAPRMKLPHQEVVHVDFSPSEHFAVTRRQPIADNDPQVCPSLSSSLVFILLPSLLER